ncbi:NmrA family protein [Ophiocordyceps sinensis CO18]|uniref:NmrA family protein n=1 Tax=Ophiocordyceps sinensis (strain Co18 / CGMCC 3.14243) TaxID=911162 RepID=T5ADL5_OPHSC|nr:NmrA family protein [Ophiocordyceps sinensis CO18]
MTGGKIRMKAMQMKNEIEKYARQPGKFATVTPINAGWYLENFLSKETAPIFGGFPHVVDDEGYLTFRVPHWGGDEQVPFLSIGDDYGDIVHGIFLDPASYNGHVVHGASHLLSFDQLVADFEEVTGRKSRFEPILPSWEAFDTLGIAEMDDVKLMFGFAQTTGGRYFGPEPSETRTAAELKRATAVALGRPGASQRLMTPKEWFKARFGT